MPIEYFEKWKAPDRDSFSVRADPAALLGEQLWALLQMDGLDGHADSVVKQETGTEIDRPRRWHKLFERLGLMYRKEGLSIVTPLGTEVAAATNNVYEQLLRVATTVARRFQLKNPLDEDDNHKYPRDCDVHPYWAILKAAAELDWMVHWDELNRELMWVLRQDDLAEVIERIKTARQQPDYDPANGGGSRLRLRERAYDQDTAPEGRDPAGQVRDQKATPWLKRAGFGELLLESPGQEGKGYWTVPVGARTAVAAAVSTPPAFHEFDSAEDWTLFLGAPVASDSPAAGRVTGGENTIFFGPPGTGKTTVVHRKTAGWDVIRCTFHPEYSYGDFVGTFRPVTGKDPSAVAIIGSDGETRQRPLTYYDFVAGPFTEAVRTALENPLGRVALVIEEINRGDCAGVFGDVFQLLDRDDKGASQFPILMPDAVRGHLRDAGIAAADLNVLILPSNLWLFATMNTSDQSLYPMDAAFKRRWNWESVSIDSDVGDLLRVVVWQPAQAARVEWLPLIRALNNTILSAKLSEDRRIGPRFLSPSMGEIGRSALRNKLLFYLWHDVFKTRHNLLFLPEIRSFDDAQNAFDRLGFAGIFVPAVIAELRGTAIEGSPSLTNETTEPSTENPPAP